MIVSKNLADMKMNVVPRIEVTRGIGFKFDLDDYHRMYYACRAAAKFMETYGSGRESYEIDLSHYEKGITNKRNKG